MPRSLCQSNWVIYGQDWLLSPGSFWQGNDYMSDYLIWETWFNDKWLMMMNEIMVIASSCLSIPNCQSMYVFIQLIVVYRESDRRALVQLKRTLQWRHNDHGGVSYNQPHGSLLNRFFRRRSKKTSNLRVTGHCAWKSPVPVNFPQKGPVTRKMVPFDDRHHVVSLYSECIHARYGWFNGCLIDECWTIYPFALLWI